MRIFRRTVLAAICVWTFLTPAAAARPMPPATALPPAGTPAGQTSAPPAVPPLDSMNVLVPFEPPSTRYGPGHRGVDLAAPVGATVYAAADGTVVFAGMLAGRGVVSIRHTAMLRTTYEPVEASVQAGDVVRAGDPIGQIAGHHPRCAPATCLHWGARLADGHYRDPMGLLQRPVFRLKPWRA